MSIYVVYGGWQNTIIDAQVVRPLERVPGSEIYFLCQSLSSFRQSTQNKKNYRGPLDIHVIPIISPYLVCDIFLNRLIIFLYIFLNKKTFANKLIYCRTEYSVMYFPKARGAERFVWDIRGDLISEVTTLKKDSVFFQFLNIGKRFEKKLIYFQKHSLRKCAEGLAVSNELRDTVIGRLESNKQFPITVQPCSVPQEFQFSYNVRSELRRKLDVSDLTEIGIYCGSLDNYHIGPNLFEIFKYFSRYDRLLVLLTRNTQAAEQLLSSMGLNSNNICLSVPHHEVHRYMHAADYAIFDREDLPLTRVSSPVKIAEYLSSGLELVGNVPVDQVHELFPDRILSLRDLTYRKRLNSTQERLEKSHVAYEYYKEDRLVTYLTQL